MPSKIKNVDQLRDEVLDALEKLSTGEMDIAEAGIIAKLSETVISGLKTQMQYAVLTKSQPHIPFLGVTIQSANEPKLIEQQEDEDHDFEFEHC